MMKPLGIVVATGLGFATFITLFMTPTLYAVVDDIATFLRRLVFGEQAIKAERRTLARAHVSSLGDGEEENEIPPPPHSEAVSAGGGRVPATEGAREQPER